jgi:putative phosphoesterase
MRIAVVSDSHRNLYMLDNAIKSAGNVDLIVHLGDCVRDIIKVNEKYKKPVEYVFGNNDFGISPVYEKVLIKNGIRILLTHGHRYNLYYGVEDLYSKALEVEAQVVLYGHTHIQNVERIGDILFLNPGSVSLPRDGKPGFAILTINKKGEVDVELLRL